MFRTTPRLFNLLIQVTKSKESVKCELLTLEVFLKLLKMDGPLGKVMGVEEPPLPPTQKKKQQKQNVFIVCNLCFFYILWLGNDARTTRAFKLD